MWRSGLPAADPHGLQRRIGEERREARENGIRRSGAGIGFQRERRFVQTKRIEFDTSEKQLG
ncbi:MAG: hypothetical protein A49_17340 [Methyloceanibacter sp.]|nr:MAG: hypothetical protein A49_17340 [Methyloceanibacter sp.]